MLKRRYLFSLATLLFFAVAGCASYMPMGSLYVGAKGGIGASTGEVSYTKVGTAEVTSIMGLVAFGDGSITTAAKNGGIKKIKYVDYEVENILGVIGKYKTVVYGD
ncbi:MAG: hypothetical protein HXY46_10950 [Syntrophaceae bacterium]|nr:hypothetical protein [Syntrophaceae bacterium]